MKTNELNYYIESHDINFSSNDEAAQIARFNAFDGLSTIFSCMDALGILGADSKFIELPDFTYSKNVERWNAGFSNGCIIYLDTNKTSFIPIGFRPNSCGVTFAKIKGWDGDEEKFLKKFKKILNSIPNANKNDFGRKNHFVGIYKNNNEYYIILHGSFSKIKTGINGLPGLYFDKDSYWNNNLKKYSYKNRELVYLISEAADEFYECYKKYEVLSTKLRKQIVNELFEENEVIFEGTHQGFYDINTILLGGYISKNPLVCPIMVSPNLPLYEVENTEKTVFINNQKYFFLPHGAGYKLIPGCSAKNTNIKNAFLLHYNNDAKVLTESIDLLPYEYRHNIIDLCCSKHELGYVKRIFSPVLNVKV